MTDLIKESKLGHLEIVKELLKAKADVNKADTLGNTPLIWASYKGHLEIIKELLKAKADVNKANINDGNTPLILASYNGHLEIVKELLKAKANINTTDTDENTPLIWASHNGHLEIVKELLKAKADVNKADTDGYTPLIWASQNGYLEIVKELLKAKADVNKADTDGNPPLLWASRNNHLEIVKELLKVKGIIRNYESLKTLPKESLDLIFPEAKKIQSLYRGSLTRKETNSILREISMMPSGKSITIIKPVNKKLKSIRISMLRHGSKITEKSKNFIKSSPILMMTNLTRNTLLKKSDIVKKLRAKSEELRTKEKKNPKGRFSVDLTDRETKKLEKLIMRPFELVEKELDGNLILYR